MDAYSKEFRRDVLAACDAGGGTREVALKFGVSESWVHRVKQECREQGKVAPKSTRDRRKSWEQPFARSLDEGHGGDGAVKLGMSAGGHVTVDASNCHDANASSAALGEPRLRVAVNRGSARRPITFRRSWRGTSR